MATTIPPEVIEAGRLWDKLPPAFKTSSMMIKAITAIANKIEEPELRKTFALKAIKDFHGAVEEMRKIREAQGKGFFGKLLGGVPVIGPLATGIEKFVKKGIAFGVNLVGNVALAPLIPFIPAMKKEVKKKGKAPKGGLSGLANQFREEVLAKKSYACYDVTGYNRQLYDKYYLAPLAAGALVKLILDYFNGLKDKREKGETLTKNEQDILKTVDTAEATIKEEALRKVDETTGSWIREHSTELLIAGGSIVAVTMVIIGVKMSKKAA